MGCRAIWFCDCNDTTGIDDIIGCVKNAAVGKACAVGGTFQLIVGSSSDNRRLNVWNGAAVEASAKGAWCKNIAGHFVGVFRIDDGGIECIERPFQAWFPYIRDDQLGTILVQMFGNAEANRAQALQRDIFARQIIRAEGMAPGGLDAAINTESGEGTRIPEAGSRCAADIGGNGRHQIGVRTGDAHIFRCYISICEAFDVMGKGLQQFRAFVGMGVANDD